jgi:hypothetical protein
LSGRNRYEPVTVPGSGASCDLRHARAAGLPGLRTGWFGRWADGVTAMRGDCAVFASHWQAHSVRVLTATGPLWVAPGDSTAQGLGAASPGGGYVGQVLAELRLRTGEPWRVLNLSVSGALMRDVLARQLPQLPAAPALVTCGAGANDVLYSAPGRLFAACRWPRCRVTSLRRGTGNSRRTASIPARPATGTGPALLTAVPVPGGPQAAADLPARPRASHRTGHGDPRAPVR